MRLWAGGRLRFSTVGSSLNRQRREGNTGGDSEAEKSTSCLGIGGPVETEAEPGGRGVSSGRPGGCKGMRCLILRSQRWNGFGLRQIPGVATEEAWLT